MHLTCANYCILYYNAFITDYDFVKVAKVAIMYIGSTQSQLLNMQQQNMQHNQIYVAT